MSARRMVGYEKLTVSSTAVGFASIPANASLAIARCEEADVRFRGDGTNPTATDGMLLDADTLEAIEIGGPVGSLSAARFIRAGGTDGKIHVAYY